MTLRIEDIDPTRCRPEFREAIFEDLRWLGVRWDGDPWNQSDRTSHYQSALDRLWSLGVLYRCFCTRKEILSEINRAGEAPQGSSATAYPGTCRSLDPDTVQRRLEEGRPYALRVHHERALALVGNLEFTDRVAGLTTVDLTQEGDFVVARKETPTSYHLSVVVDDAAQGVTLVTRGQDLLSATHPQRLLQALLGLPEPEYWHHGLVTDGDGQRLAKRIGSTSIRAHRQAGRAPQDVIREAIERVRQ